MTADTNKNLKPFTPFDPNFIEPAITKAEQASQTYGAILPSASVLGAGPVTSPAEYAHLFTQSVAKDSFDVFCEGLAKSIKRAPNPEGFAKLSLMPNQISETLYNWPGVPPELLTKIADDNFFPKAIIQQRTMDVLRYSSRSSHPWKPGWKVVLRNGFTAPTKKEKEEITEAESFISNCAYGQSSAKKRDSYGYRPFRNFLAGFARDRYRYDFVTVYTSTNSQDQVDAFKIFPAGQVRLATPKGYNGDKEIFAVALDEGNSVTMKFTRKDLFTSVMNERSDAAWGGYGYPETEQALRILQGITDAWELNSTSFSKNAVPNGIMLAHGMWGPRQIEILTAMWKSLKSGVSKGFALPVMAMPKDGKLEILDLTRMKENADYYSEYINMATGLYCAISGFPVQRLGYHTSGTKGNDSLPDAATTSGTVVDSDDPGLAPLLEQIASGINEYILWTRWPHLQFIFCGANPKEDAREYEARKNASTWGETRALADLVDGEKLAQDDEQKELMAYMNLCPVEPVVAAVFQNIVTTLISAKAKVASSGEEKPDGARMASKIDPAESEKHGGTSGVRRDSAAEKKKSYTSLYINRPVLNYEDIYNWAVTQGISNIVDPETFHVTIAYSEAAVDWDSMGNAPDEIHIPKSDKGRKVDYLGTDGALVLKFSSAALQMRWNRIIENGASWNFEGYQPHITISWDSGGADVSDMQPYEGDIFLGEEEFQPLDPGWRPPNSLD